MKCYPETKSFNLWPIYNPENIDKRRTEIGLDSIAVFLKNRFDFKWNLEEQIRRTKEFELKKQESSKNELTNSVPFSKRELLAPIVYSTLLQTKNYEGNRMSKVWEGRKPGSK